MLLMVMAVVLPFVRVTTFCPPRFPTATDAQLKLVGETETVANALVVVPASAHAIKSVLSTQILVSPDRFERPGNPVKTRASDWPTKAETADKADLLRM
jgi:hypothetical protein